MAEVSKKKKTRKGSAQMRELAKRLAKNAKEGKAEPIKHSMEKVGYSETTARSKAREIVSSETFRGMLMERGTVEKVDKVIQEALEAKQGSWYQGIYYEDDKPDHQTRLKASSHLADLAGTKVLRVEQKNLNVNTTPQELKDLMADLL